MKETLGIHLEQTVNTWTINCSIFKCTPLMDWQWVISEPFVIPRKSMPAIFLSITWDKHGERIKNLVSTVGEETLQAESFTLFCTSSHVFIWPQRRPELQSFLKSIYQTRSNPIRTRTTGPSSHYIFRNLNWLLLIKIYFSFVSFIWIWNLQICFALMIQCYVALQSCFMTPLCPCCK